MTPAPPAASGDSVERDTPIERTLRYLRNRRDRMAVSTAPVRPSGADGAEMDRREAVKLQEEIDAIESLRTALAVAEADARLLADAMSRIDDDIEAGDGTIVMVSLDPDCERADAIRAAIARHRTKGIEPIEGGKHGE